MTKDELKIALIKYRKSLTVAGEAMMTFGVWTALKVILTMFGRQEELMEVIDVDALDLSSGRVIFILGLFLFVVIGFSLSIHLIIGINAYQEGHGRKKGIFYLLVTVLFLVSILVEIVQFILSPGYRLSFIEMNGISAIAFDLTVAGICLDVLYSAFMTRKTRNRLASLEVEQ